MKNKKNKEFKIICSPIFQKQMGLEPSKECRPLDECFKEMKVWQNKWYNKYFILPFHWYFLNQIENACDAIKYFTQRLFRGYDDREVWNLDWYLKKWLAPRLEKLLETHHGMPINPDTKKPLTEKQWKKILKEILWWAKNSDKEEDELSDKYYLEKEISEIQYKKKYKRICVRRKNATENFGKYVGCLWD